jgi:hypothetical protein
MNGNATDRRLKVLGLVFVVALLLAAALVASAFWALGSMGPGTVQINGEPLVFSDLDSAGWLLGVGGTLIGLLVALLVVLVVVPVAVLVPLGVAALVVIGALVGAAGVLAVALSPLLLLIGFVWLVVRLVRRGDDAKRRERAHTSTEPAAGATIAG